MSTTVLSGHRLTADEYLSLEQISPFKHEFADGVMYAMHVASAKDYLELETRSPFRHEYMRGVMYAMAGGKKAHHRLSRNLSGILYNALRGKRCTNVSSNMKLRLPSGDPDDPEFCYPDEMISCDPTDEGETDGHAWIARPSVIFEIASESTRRVDEGQKRDAYLEIGSLDAYVRIEQDRPEVVVERRVGALWVVDRVSGLNATVKLQTVEVQLSLAELYERVKFPA